MKHFAYLYKHPRRRRLKVIRAGGRNEDSAWQKVKASPFHRDMLEEGWLLYGVSRIKDEPTR
jgi:hypothetical protein